MLAIVHLTDIHIADPLDPILTRAGSIARAIGGFCSSICDEVSIVVSGDIAYSGKRNQFDLAISLFHEITTKLEEDHHLTTRYIVCPGNHDCDFDGDQEFRELALKSIFAGNRPSDRAIEECTSVQKCFFDFVDELCGFSPASPAEKLRYEIPITTRDGTAIFDCINLSWVSRLHEERVTFPAELIPQVKASSGLRVTVFHHPFRWLHVSSYSEFRKRVQAGADIVLTGHQHEWAVLESRDTDSGSTVLIEGDVLQNRKLPDYSAFSVILIDEGDESYRVQKFELLGEAYARAEEKEEWASFRHFRIAAPKGNWEFSFEFETALTDLGMSLLTNSGYEIKLDDVFVFPELEEATGDSEKSRPSSLESLLAAADNARGFIIQGDERSGRTSLLKQLIRSSINRNLVPVLIPGQDLRRTAEDEIDKLITRAVSAQLRGGDVEAWRQLPTDAKIIFVDDVDESPIRAEKVLALLLDRLAARCGRLVITVSDTYETSQIVSEAADGVFQRLPTYRVLQFGYLARAKLINRWALLNSSDGDSEDDKISRVHSAEVFVGGVLKRGVVPAYPIYLLALLHAESAKRGETLEDGGVGHYYEYLISRGILNAGIAKELDEIYDYCTQLAWYIAKTSAGECISLEQFRLFNVEYSREWHTVEFGARQKALVDARLIVVNGDAVGFRYAYLYYYFLARYLSSELDDAMVMEYIRESAAHLYVRARANVLVFLTHFTTDARVMETILSSLKGQFSESEVVQFNKQGDTVDALLKDLPKLIYDAGDPLKRREQVALAKDELGTEDDLPDQPFEADSSSVPCRLATVFRAIEIVGQILKVRYSKFRRIDKEVMVQEVIEAPLKALEGFYDLLRKHPAALIAEVTAFLAENAKTESDSDREQLVRRMLGMIVLGVSFGFIRKISEALSAEVLRENLDSVVAARGGLTFKLVGLACCLDGQRDLPRKMIAEVLELGNGSLVVENLVRLMVLYRMHMFRVKAPDVKWARDNLGISQKESVRALAHAILT